MTLLSQLSPHCQCALLLFCAAIVLLFFVFFFFFFLNEPAPPEISPLPLHAALPIYIMVNASRHKRVNLDALALLPEGGGWLMVEFGAATAAGAESHARNLMQTLAH